MTKFEYAVFHGIKEVEKFANSLPRSTKIKKILIDKTLGPLSKALSIMGQEGWELVSVGINNLDVAHFIFKRKS
jgi:hypothetical protein